MQCVLTFVAVILLYGIPKEIEITETQVAESLSDAVGAIINAVKNALENAAPELAADIVESGIVLTGGGALLRNLNKVLSEATGLIVKIADNPLDCVALGTGQALEQMDSMRDVLEKIN